MGRKTWYEPAGDLGEGYPRLLHSRYDNLFKHIISSGWAVRSDGDVEALSGFFALVEIPARLGEFTEMLEAINTGLPASIQYPEPVWPAAGWYVTCELNSGIIFVNEYFSQSRAEAAYDESMTIYNKWLVGDDVDEIAPKPEPKCPRCNGERFIEIDQQVQEVGMVAERVPCPVCNEAVDLTDPDYDGPWDSRQKKV